MGNDQNERTAYDSRSHNRDVELCGTATGPGLLTWQLTLPSTIMISHVLCDGVALPFLPTRYFKPN